ncbi:MAG: hypothetical protein M1820_002390 [Bogoriella megaspora]|nr:MAG: hypothetical protein M1820_002390 [Bogoriella megaspora]
MGLLDTDTPDVVLKRGGKRQRYNKETAKEPSGPGLDDHRNKRVCTKHLARGDTHQASINIACPYAKRSPAQYGRDKSCMGPSANGWPNINRLKGHLRRHHFIHICPRCCRRFKAKDELTRHVTALAPCLRSSERDFLDGFDEDQLQSLQFRKDKGLSRAEKADDAHHWCNMYKILFPEDAESEIPSPTIDSMTVNLTEYHEFCTRALIQDERLRNSLTGALVKSDHDFVEVILHIVQQAQGRYKQQYAQKLQYQDPQIEPATSKAEDQSRKIAKSAPQVTSTLKVSQDLPLSVDLCSLEASVSSGPRVDLDLLHDYEGTPSNPCITTTHLGNELHSPDEGPQHNTIPSKNSQRQDGIPIGVESHDDGARTISIAEVLHTGSMTRDETIRQPRSEQTSDTYEHIILHSADLTQPSQVFTAPDTEPPYLTQSSEPAVWFIDPFASHPSQAQRHDALHYMFSPALSPLSLDYELLSRTR